MMRMYIATRMNKLFTFIVIAVVVFVLLCFCAACAVQEIKIPLPAAEDSVTTEDFSKRNQESITEQNETHVPTEKPAPELESESGAELEKDIVTETDQKLDIQVISEAYLKILAVNKHEVNDYYTRCNVLQKDITGDGVPELMYIQADFDNSGFGEPLLNSEEQPPTYCYLVIWSYENEPQLLLKRELSLSAAQITSFYIFAGYDGKQIYVYKSIDNGIIYAGDFYNYFTIESFSINNGVFELTSSDSIIERRINNYYSNEHTYLLNGTEITHDSFSNIWDNALDKSGNILLFCNDQDYIENYNNGNNSFASKGIYEVAAELEYIELSEDERMNYIVHGAYTDLIAPGITIRLGSTRHNGDYYYLMDMNDDGVDELLVAALDENIFWTWNIYTYKDGIVTFLNENDNAYNAATSVSIVGDRFIALEAARTNASGSGIYTEYTGYDGEQFFILTENSWSEFLNSGELGEPSIRYGLNGQSINEREFNRLASTISGNYIPFKEAFLPIPDNSLIYDYLSPWLKS